jgi:4-amino-4-deoxy-L-arabinose transferase-like glycosyltransferase
MISRVEFTISRSWLKWSLLSAALLLCGLRLFYLNADFPNYSQWGVDQAKYTDEGWWANAAVMHHILGHWNIPGDYNPAVAVPVWPLLLGATFHFTGVSIFAARGVSVLLSIGTLGIVFLLVRRYSDSRQEVAAPLSALLLAASPFAFVFSRIAILDTFVVFQFCLLMLVASYASKERWWPLLILAILVAVMVLTKTTAVLLLPAVLWIMWTALKKDVKTFIGTTLLAGIVSAAIVKVYVSLAILRGFGPDYHYFFAVNQPEDIPWGSSFGIIAGILRNGIWIDHILYPLALLMMILVTLWARRLWRNPLFAASWIAFACQAIFIFSRQDDYPPRYFLVMLVPVIIGLVLAIEEISLHNKTIYYAVMAMIAVSLTINVTEIFSFLHHRTFQLYGAATSIAGIVRADAKENPLILGVSGSQISLMTGVPSINDAYGTQDPNEKLLRYHPGWYLAWNGIGHETKITLSPYEIERVATYPVFDDADRNELILYRIMDPAR